MISQKKAVFFGTLAAFFANLFFGFSNMFSKLALSHAQPLFILTLRFTLAFIILNIPLIFRKAHLNLKGKNLLPPVLLGLCQPLLYMIFELYGISLTSSATSGVIISLSPVLVLSLSGIFLKETPSPLQWLFSAVSLFGVALIALCTGDGQKTYPLGVLLLILAATCASGFNLLSRKLSGEFSSYERTYITFAVSCVGFNILLPLIQGENYKAAFSALECGEFIISIIYLSLFSSVFAFFLYNYAVSKIPAYIASSFSNIITVVSIFAGVFILHETLTLYQFIGCALIILGVLGVNKFKKTEGS